MDKIIIQGLEVKSLIGVYDWERDAKQELLVDASLVLDLTAASQSDNVTDTIDYAMLAKDIEFIADSSEFALLEALAAEMLTHILSIEGVQRASVAITKPNILANAKAVTVELSREKG